MRIWVIPQNDGEAVEIGRLLCRHGERFVTTRQGWGASWAGLEREIQAQLREFRGDVLGVELAGPNEFGARNVDHHWYAAEDRRNALSSLEQVASILGVELGRHEMLVALNDRGYIPAMKEFGAGPEEIADVRSQDRRAQGVTEADEAQARADIVEAEWRGRKVFVRCRERATSAHSDFLFGEADEILLADPGEWNYYGPRHREFAELDLPELERWSGGSDTGGYFGVKVVSLRSAQELLALFWGGRPAAISAA